MSLCLLVVELRNGNDLPLNASERVLWNAVDTVFDALFLQSQATAREDYTGFASSREVGHSITYENDYWNRAINTLSKRTMLVLINGECFILHENGAVKICQMLVLARQSKDSMFVPEKQRTFLYIPYVHEFEVKPCPVELDAFSISSSDSIARGAMAVLDRRTE